MIIPTTLLLAPAAFGGALPADRVAAAMAVGLQRAGAPPPDLCPVADGDRATVLALLAELDFDDRMRRARAVIVGDGLLDRHTLRGTIAFEIATRARQSGVPAYAVAARNDLDPFDARIIDLQVVLTAVDEPALRRAGARLAELV